jgi:hypothetical protein
MSIIQHTATLFIALLLLTSCSQPASNSKDENPLYPSFPKTWKITRLEC